MRIRKRQSFVDVTLGRRAGIAGPPAPEPVPPVPGPDPLAQARMEAETARAEAARIARELEELRRSQPSAEQLARLQELESAARAAEEERARKAGEFDQWRRQIDDEHKRKVAELEEAIRAAKDDHTRVDRELDSTLVGREFADATDLFGPSGRTVLIPDMAQKYFAEHVEVQQVPGTTRRRVVVKDFSGAVILDSKTGQPATFSIAMGELINNHPRRADILRNSGKVGANSPGGGNGGGQIDTRNLKSRDFARQDVRDAVRDGMAGAGGLQIGPAFDRMAARTKK